MDKEYILVIDDDVDFSMLICDMLEDNGYTVKYADSMDKAYRILSENMAQLILLDINLPDGTGFELCRELRRVSNVPIIFASARTSEKDKVDGLDMGGDDYLSKPYSLKELLSRINAIIRRTYGTKEGYNSIKIITPDNSEVVVDKNSRLVKKDGVVVGLAPKEYDLLIYLIENKGKVLTKELIINKVWGPYSDVEQSTLTVHIRWLREKFEKEPSKPKWIKTVWGLGYMME
ncbi:MAG: response regulator transcription factor [Clostridiales bacterium]|uniref:response regulator transcription factor n=1 Tax=Clostridium sp. N3C TaxID=1776758 RepID=UPI00092E0678|nr:response regulator transcription factor [Clostridium sp. N3C]NLZ49868.1 response regulator transcription factor [Clostridiales bacterium]SCN24132.1 KDP operon transcriptional regulatory protein KdpE [Clostridium sp. N3C]